MKKSRRPPTKKPGKHGPPPRAVQDSRAALRAERRRLEAPTRRELQETIARIQANQQQLLARESDLKENAPPSQKDVEAFEHDIRLQNKELKALEDKLNDNPGRLLGEFEELLRTQESLLKSFEDLLDYFDPLPAGLLDSFRALLEDMGDLLDSFESLIAKDDPPSEELVVSLENLIQGEESDDGKQGYEELLKSYEDLLKKLETLTPNDIDRFFILLTQLEILLTKFQSLLITIEIAEGTPGPNYLLESFEDLLRGYEDLLKSSEALLSRIVPPPSDLIKTLKRSLEGLNFLLECFENRIAGFDVLPEKLVESYRELLLSDQERGFADLLLGFEDLLGRVSELSPDLISDFEDLLRLLEDRVESYNDLVLRLPRKKLLPVHRSIDLLKAVERRLESFEQLLKRIQPPPVELVTSFENLLSNFQISLLIGGYLLILANNFPSPPPKGLITSLAELLERLGRLLKSYEDVLNSFDKAPLETLVSFEDLLRTYEVLLLVLGRTLDSYKAPPEELVTRFEDLLTSQDEEWGLADLLRSFEDLVKTCYPDSEALIKSFKDLIDTFLELMLKLDDLKDKIEPLSDDLILSDFRLYELYTDLLSSYKTLLSGSSNLSSQDADKFLDAAIQGEKMLIAFVSRLSQQRPLSATVRRALVVLRSDQTRKVADAVSIVRAVAEPSVFVNDAAQDLEWLHDRFEQAAIPLTGRSS